MSPNVSYEGNPSCLLANVQAEDLDSLASATRELMTTDTKVSGVRIKNFLETEHIEAIIDATRRISLKKLAGTSFDNELYTLGVPQSMGRLDPSAYFQKANAWRQDPVFMETIGPDSDVIQHTVRTLESAFGTPLHPAEQEGHPLLPATLRCIDFACIHKDVIADHVQWDIAKLRDDIAWNIYLQMPQHGGELVLYPPAAARLTQVRDTARFTPINVRSAPGDLIFFRSMIPHGVNRSSDPDTRLTISGCIGFEPPPAKKARYWA